MFVTDLKTNRVSGSDFPNVHKPILTDFSAPLLKPVPFSRALNNLSPIHFYAFMWKSGKEAEDLLEEYRQGAYVEIEIDNEAKERALEIFAGQKSKNLPFFDAIHFATIEKLGIKKVLGFDKHFEKFGFELVK